MSWLSGEAAERSPAERIDEAVRAWALSEFKRWDHFNKHDVRKHLQVCRTTEAVHCDHSAQCQCYSEYTRDDVWSLVLWVRCGCLVEAKWSFEPRSWLTLPDVIEGVRQAELDLAECEFDGL